MYLRPYLFGMKMEEERERELSFSAQLFGWLRKRAIFLPSSLQLKIPVKRG